MTVSWNGTVHEVADWFPLLTPDRWDDFLKDIKENGLQNPIVLDPTGQLLDGRNRLRAVNELGIEPTWRVEEGNARDFIISVNLHRRHLTDTERAFIGAKLTKEYEAEAAVAKKEGQRKGGRTKSKSISTPSWREKQEQSSNTKAARRLEVAPSRVRTAKAVAEESDLVEAVKQGTLSLSGAAKEARRRKQERKHAANPGKPLRVSSTKPTFNETNDFVGWAKWTWNPVTGCQHDCVYCYARELAEKYQKRGEPGYAEGFAYAFHPDRLPAPTHTKIPGKADPTDRLWDRVFVCSMSDLWGKWVPADVIRDVLTACNAAPDWTYMFLTKFPSRYAQFQAKLPPHSWVGATVDYQHRVLRTEQAMTKVSAEVRWLSCEPLLEDLTFHDLSMFDLVVVGAQTAIGATSLARPQSAVPPRWEWVQHLVEQADAAGVPIYLKDNLLGRTDGQHPGMVLRQEPPR